MLERVRVVVRIRPFLPTDPEEADLTTLMLDDTHLTCGSHRVFRVDRVYKMEDDTQHVYEQSVKPVVTEFLSGFNSTVMAYGQTGTGKTFTISALLPLILGQVVQDGFHGSTEDLSFQYIEVYGDSLRDLLSEDPVASAKSLQIYDGQAGGGGGPSPSPPHSAAPLPGGSGAESSPVSGSFVSGALRVTASSLEEVFDILAFGTANRATGATNVHQHSSRSHSVFTIFNHKTRGKLHIVDLAGSERNKKTLNVGQRLQESIAINGGLLALGNVIRALSKNHSNVKGGSAAHHVPYRSSKLTRLLQDALGGNGKTLFISCVAPDSLNIDETLRTLQYCALAMKVMNTPVKQYDELYRKQMGLYRRKNVGPHREEGEAATESFVRLDSASPPDRGDEAAQQLEMYRQFCAEQEAEIMAMREELASSTARVQLCEEELHKDEFIFTRQISEMERLVLENMALRWALNGQQPPHTITEDFASATRRVDPAAVTPAHVEETVKKTLPYLRKTLAFDAAAAGASESVTLATPLLRPPSAAGRRHAFQASDDHALETNEGAAAAAPAWLRSSAGLGGEEDAAALSHFIPIEDDSSSRDKQMLALTKEALHYQRTNARLRHDLSGMTVSLETERREAAMLRLELNELHELLK